MTLLSICVLSGDATADASPAEVKGKKPLDNRELHQLRRDLGAGEKDKMKHIKGTEVKVKVQIHIRQDKTVWCTVLSPDKSKMYRCGAHLTGFEPHFSSGLKDAEVYLLEGMIVENRLCYGAFWIYASRLTRVDQPATAEESATKGKAKP